MKPVFPILLSCLIALVAGLVALESTPAAQETEKVIVKGVACPITIDADGTERVSLRNLPIPTAYGHRNSQGEVEIHCKEGSSLDSDATANAEAIPSSDL